MWLPDGKKCLKLYLLISTEYTNVTDRQTDTARRHRPRLCIASRGKNTKRRATHLSKVVEVVLMSNPFVRRVRSVVAVGLIVDVTNVRSFAVVKRTFEQLSTKTHNSNVSDITST